MLPLPMQMCSRLALGEGGKEGASRGPCSLQGLFKVVIETGTRTLRLFTPVPHAQGKDAAEHLKTYIAQRTNTKNTGRTKCWENAPQHGRAEHICIPRRPNEGHGDHVDGPTVSTQLSHTHRDYRCL